LPSSKNINASDSDLLVQFVFKLFDITIPELENMAHQVIVDYINISQDRSVLSNELKTRLSKIGFSQIKALSILKSVMNEHADYVVTFKAEISALSVSDDLSVRLIASEIATCISIDTPPISKERQELPFCYEIELPVLDNTNEAIPYSAIAPGESFPDLGDPLEMIRPFSFEAELIARMSEIPIQNIITRTVSIMHTLMHEELWNKAAEEKFKKWMKGIQLELTYHRLRPQIAKMALSNVACELIDANKISQTDTVFLRKIFEGTDSYMLSIVPIIKPNFINIYNSENRNYMHDHEKWLIDINNSLKLFNKTDNQDHAILGELTKWCWLDWEKPTETRLSMVCHNQWQDWDTPIYASSFFPSKIHWKAEDYPKIDNIQEPSLVIYGSPIYVDLGGTKWLALNPVIGHSLGWTISSSGLFRWVNSTGEIMVESIFWKDGPIGRQAPKMDDVCSDGWLVVASKSAVESIKKLTGQTIKIDAVVRSYGKNPYSLTTRTTESRNRWI